MPAIAHHFRWEARRSASGDLTSRYSSDSRLADRCLMNIGAVTVQAIKESTPRSKKAP